MVMEMAANKISAQHVERANDLAYLLNYKASEAVTDENNRPMLTLLKDVSFWEMV